MMKPERLKDVIDTAFEYNSPLGIREVYLEIIDTHPLISDIPNGDIDWSESWWCVDIAQLHCCMVVHEQMIDRRMLKNEQLCNELLHEQREETRDELLAFLEGSTLEESLPDVGDVLLHGGFLRSEIENIAKITKVIYQGWAHGGETAFVMVGKNLVAVKTKNLRVPLIKGGL